MSGWTIPNAGPALLGSPSLPQSTLDRADRLFVPAAALLYALIALTVIARHEPWRDEADAWLAARDLSLPALVHWTRYAGHPSLWYLLLMPFAKSGFPYISLHLVHFGLALAAVVVFLRFGPFSRGMKAGVVFSYPILYEYAVVARDYVLCVLLLWGLAALYPRRFERPLSYAGLILLLFNSVPHSVVPAGLLLALFGWDASREGRLSRPVAMALAVGALGGVLALVQLWPPPDGQLHDRLPDWNAAICAAANAALPLSDEVQIDARAALGAWLALSVLAGVFLALLQTPRALLLLCGSYAWLFYIFVFKWYGGRRHAGLLLVFLLFALWIAWHERRQAGRAKASQEHWSLSLARLFPTALLEDAPRWTALSAALCLASGWVAAAHCCWFDLHERFSDAEAIARFIREGRFDDHVIAAHPSTMGSAVLPYLAHDVFWYPGSERYGSHMTWDAKFERGEHLPAQKAAERVRERFADQENVLLLLNCRLQNADELGFDLLHTTNETGCSARGEIYFLYRKRTGHELRDREGS